MRVTWNAVTRGTPSCSTFAVIDISAMPPGAVPSTSDGVDWPDSHPMTAAKPAESTIENNTVTATATQ